MVTDVTEACLNQLCLAFYYFSQHFERKPLTFDDSVTDIKMIDIYLVISKASNLFFPLDLQNRSYAFNFA